MIKQVFIGGHFSSGTRVVQFLLKQFYDIATKRQEEGCDHDYEEGFSTRPTFGEQVLAGSKPAFPGILPEKFSVKNPEFMFCVPYLKELYPESKFILVVRNGLDQVLCDNRCMEDKLGQYFDFQESDYLKRQMEFWNKAYKKAIKSGGIDLTVRLEDLVVDPKRQARNIARILGLKTLPDHSMINKPDSLGRSKKEYTIKLPVDAAVNRMERFEYHYEPSMKQALYKVGKEMMDYFGYGI